MRAQAIARRLILAPLRLFYRIKVDGRAHVPPSGPALFVSNHVSFIDAFLIAAACPRPVRFLMFRAYYDLPIVGWFFKAMGCIPISDRDSPKALIESFRRAREALQAGEAVGIFAEGEISRHGQLLRFKKGFERIVDGLAAAVIPVHLDQVWGSAFSFAGGRVLFKRPRRFPYPVTVSFGAPLSSDASAFQVRQSIVELGARAFRHRLSRRPSLPVAFIREAKHHPFRLALADSHGCRYSCAGALAAAHALGRRLGFREQTVGVLMPTSAEAALANLALFLRGCTVVNLNHSAGEAAVQEMCDRAKVAGVVVDERLARRLGWRLRQRCVSAVPAPRGRLELLFALLPAWALERFIFPSAKAPVNRLAAILFTSGSTGRPKGVCLTHENILANIEGATQLFPIGPHERLLSSLPLFHAFGLTGTFWLPLLSGMGAVYHDHPFDPDPLGELAQRYRATFFIGTPTMLLGLIRRVAPEKLRTLERVVVGSEKLRDAVGQAFFEKFGVEPLEGYGCTELSPVASVNIPDIDWPGVRQKGGKTGTIGHPLPGVYMKVVDPETREERAAGEPGLLLVKGPGVMRGYLDDPAATEAAIHDGYYSTGDIASIDADGFVTITDRLSRFSKIAGEMVPHLRVEEELQRAMGAVEQQVAVVGVPDEKRGEKLVVFHAGLATADELWQKLQASSLPKLWIPDRASFVKLEELPTRGPGKVDLKALREKALAAPGA